MKKVKKFSILVFFIILTISFIIRIIAISSPIADWHSWRQVDTASVARGFIENGIDLLHPTFHDFSDIQSGKYNPKGYRMVEFPIYNAQIAYLTSNIPVFSLEVWARIITIINSLILLSIIFYIAKKEVSFLAAIGASCIFGFFPFFVYYSRVILPDMNALSYMFLSIFFLYSLSQTKDKKLKSILLGVLSLLFAQLALLIKPTTIFFLLVHIYLLYSKYGLYVFRKLRFYTFFVAIIIPFGLWRLWIVNFPEGIPVMDWLITSVNTTAGRVNIFFKPSFFRWIFFERIINTILGGYTILFLILGVLVKPLKTYLIHIIGISSLMYLFIFQGGNVQHDYYQIMILPSLALFCGVGINFIINNKSFFHIFFRSIAVIAILFGSLYYSYFSIKNYYTINNQLLHTANIIDNLTEKNAIVVTDTTGDTTLLYLSKRKGYPAVSKDLLEMKNLGASYFYTSNSSVANDNKKRFKIIFENNDTYLFKL